MLRKRCSTRCSCERQGQNVRGVFKIQRNIYDGAVLQKWLMAKCCWLISHTSFTLVTLLKKLTVDIGFIIMPFSKEAVENHSRQKNRILTFPFLIAVIGHDLHCFAREGFIKDL